MQRKSIKSKKGMRKRKHHLDRAHIIKLEHNIIATIAVLLLSTMFYTAITTTPKITGMAVGIAETEITACDTEITTPGIYNLSTGITMNSAYCIFINSSDVTLDCKGNTISNAGPSGGDVIRIYENSFTQLLTNITIQGCNVNGGNAAGFRSVYATGITNLLIQNNSFVNCSNGLMITEAGYGLDNKDIVIRNNTFTGPGNPLIDLDGPLDSVHIENNTLSDSTTDSAIEIYEINDSIISNNVIWNSIRGIELQEVINITVKDNTIFNCAPDPDGEATFSWDGSGIVFNEYDSHSGNIYYNNITSCTYGMGIGQSIRDIQIYHNNIYGNTLQIRTEQAGGNVRGVNISNGSQGNYWGHAACPYFTGGGAQDSDTWVAIDSFPYDQPYASGSWPAPPASCGSQPEVTDNVGSPNVNTGNVQPTSGNQFTSYVFTATYTDDDDDAPTSMNVIINTTGTVAMVQRDPTDTTYTDGKDYLYNTTLAIGNHSYNFSTSDGTYSVVAMGDNAVGIEVVGQVEPTLASGSVSPTSGPINTVFNYTVTYTDANNIGPNGSIQVVIDDNPYSMTECDPGDAMFNDGKNYYYTTNSTTLSTVGSHSYYFNASDGTNITTTSTTNLPIIVNSAPTYSSAGVSPTSGTTSTNFNYTVTYTDANNEAPDTINVTIDGTMYPMAEIDATDTTYSNGKGYYYNQTLTAAAHTYSFTASDGTDTSSSASTSGPSVPYCGDSTCNGAETCTSCQADCGACPTEETPTTTSSGGGGGGGSSIAGHVVNTQEVSEDQESEIQEEEEEEEPIEEEEEPVEEEEPEENETILFAPDEERPTLIFSVPDDIELYQEFEAKVFIGNAKSLTDLEFSINYDSNYLTLTEVEKSGFLQDFNFDYTINEAETQDLISSLKSILTKTNSEVSITADQQTEEIISGSGYLATIKFKPINPGTMLLNFDDIQFSNTSSTDIEVITEEIEIEVIGNVSENMKNIEAYTEKELFLISDDNWQKIFTFISATIWTQNNQINKYPFLIYHKNGNIIDLDSTISFINDYNPTRITLIEDSSEDFDTLLASATSISTDKIQKISLNNYFTYWESFGDIVYVNSDYELAMTASVYASLKNIPLVIKDSITDNENIFTQKNVITINTQCPQTSTSCQDISSLTQLQQEIIEITGTDKVILINQKDIGFTIQEDYLPLKTSSTIKNLYSSTSLSAPILAAAKHEIIIFTNVDQTQQTKICEKNLKTREHFELVIQDIENNINTLFNTNPKYLTILGSPIAIPDSDFEMCVGETT